MLQTSTRNVSDATELKRLTLSTNDIFRQIVNTEIDSKLIRDSESRFDRDSLFLKNLLLDVLLSSGIAAHVALL